MLGARVVVSNSCGVAMGEAAEGSEREGVGGGGGDKIGTRPLVCDLR